MLPSFLHGSYKQYKADTDAVATWLANTAVQCGYSLNLLDGQQVPDGKVPKLKGRARMLAKQAAKDKTDKEKDDESHLRHAISVAQFLSMAEWVANSQKPLVTVPLTFETILERAIVMRKEHNSWWRDQNSTGNDQDIDQEAHQGHSYFISVLEDVKRILQPRIPKKSHHNQPTKHRARPAQYKKPERACVTNLFENLTIEEPSEEYLNTQPILLDKPIPHQVEPKFTIEQDDDYLELSLALHYLFHDLKCMRRYIQQLWQCYKRGVIDLIPASITANTAIELVQCLQEDFEKTFPKYPDLIEHLIFFYCVLREKPGEPPSHENPISLDFNVYETADDIMYPTFIILCEYLEILEKSGIHTVRSDSAALYDPASDRKLKSPADKHFEDRIVLLQILSDVSILTLKGDLPPAEDEFFRGARHMIEEKKLPFWMVFAAQVYLDANHVLRVQVAEGYQDLMKSSRSINTSIEKIMILHDSLDDGYRLPIFVEQDLDRILKLVKKWVTDDVVGKAFQRLEHLSLAHGEEWYEGPVPPHRFMRHHPLYCGLLLYRITIIFQQAGLDVANDWGSILCTAHLYNALRQEKLVNDTWQDMNLVLSMQKNNHIFIGDPPKTSETYVKRIGLATGISVTSFAKNKRHRTHGLSAGNKRCLHGLSPVSSMFRDRYCLPVKSVHMKAETIEFFLKSRAVKTGFSGKIGPNDRVFPEIVKFSPIEAPEELGLTDAYMMKPHISSSMHLIEQLDALLHAVQSEMLELTFDHLHLHISLWSLLTKIREVVGSKVDEFSGGDVFTSGPALPLMIGHILLLADMERRLRRKVHKKQFEDVSTDRLLRKVADVFNKWLQSGEGATAIAILKENFGKDVIVEDVLMPATRPSSTGA